MKSINLDFFAVQNQTNQYSGLERNKNNSKVSTGKLYF